MDRGRRNGVRELCTLCPALHTRQVSPGGFIAANAGHCVYPRVKDRKPGACGCEHFKEKRGETDA